MSRNKKTDFKDQLKYGEHWIGKVLERVETLDELKETMKEFNLEYDDFMFDEEDYENHYLDKEEDALNDKTDTN